MRRILIAFLFIGLAAPALAAEPDFKTDKGLRYQAWLPKGFATHRHDVPLILFSHALGGCARQSTFLTRALADAGYAVLAPDHRDASCGAQVGGLWNALRAIFSGRGPEKSFLTPASWTADTEAEHRADMEALLDYALRHAPYKDAIDPARIGFMGHSLGGYTGLGLAGAWPSWKDGRIKSLLVMAPWIMPFLDRQALDRIAIPVLFLQGSEDAYDSPARLADGYAQVRARKYLVMLKGAGHFAFTDMDRDYQKTITRYTIGFFDRELRHRPAPLLDRPAGGQVGDYRHSP